MCAPGGQAANPRYRRAGVVHISPTSTRNELSEEGDGYFFRLAWRDDVQARVQADFAMDRMSAHTALLVDNGEAYGEELASSFSTRFTERGGGIVARERVRRGARDFSSVVRQAVDLNPSVVVYEGLNPEGPLLLSALRTAGYPGGFIGPDGLLSGRDFIGVAGDKADGAIVTGGAVPDAAFSERYVGIYQRMPSTPFVVQAFDSMTALLKALDAVAEPQSDGSLLVDREALAEALRSQRFAGLTGSVGFDERGDRRGETPQELGIVVYRVVGGAFSPVE
jgi:branched-chain amino acid transport system substrate-binding protein